MPVVLDLHEYCMLRCAVEALIIWEIDHLVVVLHVLALIIRVSVLCIF